MLNRIRKDIEPVMNSIGLRFAATGLSPNSWTVVGFALAVLSGLLYALHRIDLEYAYLYAGMTLLVSGFFDMVDGSVARVTGRVSRAGAFLDSTLDRVAEVAIYTGIALSNVVSPVLVILALAFSLLVSYARARAEGIGVELKGIGIGERAERLLLLAVFSIAGTAISLELMQYGLIVIVVLAAITFIHRVVSVFNAVAGSSSSHPQP
ncbi:MAG: CDP-alcohol phosphatidyltransferase family protein [Candidatus Nitrosocaldus sp.]|nr:CDP-alcohol phosphatidyltransferase family protein [Candidatus Nitrosocaldus sp.]MCS7141471.1 CDP-alcohol phosphatidyltransferase family protein [Candidatus Nitrosocaldus sp.]MDW7999677.1 CDP-alcohol phosphatidyltransferase family protein [Candidatus Nitrosocaldus sp.]MDW8275331.1 CDP-alcohol phosphatidyltransferase family protein [Candidatus Nitrosocaldus sp.]